MVDETFAKGLFKIVRERIFFEHSAPDERKIIDEITILNRSNDEIRNVFLIRYEFMIGLKIFDAQNRELPYYPNEFVRNVLEQDTVLGGCLKKSKHQALLDNIKSRKAFLLWIILPEKQPLSQKESMILKLEYTTSKKFSKIKIKELLNPKHFLTKPYTMLFNIPKFQISKTRSENVDYDTFYHITAPEGSTIDYTIDKAVFVDSNGKEIDMDEKEIDKNFDGKIVYIRIPPSEKQTKFNLTYYIVPTKNDKGFYTITVLSTIIFSAIVLCTSIVGNSETMHTILSTIQNNSNILYGGIFSGSIAAIGFMKSFALQKTRFWWLIPMAISAIGFLAFR